MSPLSILTDALQSIPAPIRKGLLVVYSLAVVGLGVSRLAGFDGLDYAEESLLYVGGYLGVQSAANVGPAEPLEVAVVPPTDGSSYVDDPQPPLY